jgi:hypothetical protein
MVCDTQKNTINYLRERKVIDDTRKILDLPEFNRLNKLYTDTALTKYGVDEGPLFNVNRVYSPRAAKEGTTLFYRASPNAPVFQAIDEAVAQYDETKGPISAKPRTIVPPVQMTLFKSKGVPLKRVTELQSDVVGRMQEILDTLGIRTEVVSQVYNNQGEINNLLAELNNGKGANEKEILKKIAELQQGGHAEATAALADIANRLIQFADDQLSDDNFTEETIHFAVEVLEQKYPVLFHAMMEKIPQYETYTQVKEQYGTDKEYQTPEGKPNFPKLKKEAIAKVLTEHVLNSEGGDFGDNAKTNFINDMWNKILNFLKDFFRKIAPGQRDAFKEVADRLLYDKSFITEEDRELLTDSEKYQAKKKQPGVDRVLNKTSYQLQESITKEFADVIPTWVLTGSRPSFKNGEEAFNFFEKYRKYIQLQSVDTGEKEKDGVTPIMEDRYFFKNVPIPMRTSQVLKAAKGLGYSYSNLNETEFRKMLREIKLTRGTAVHKDMQNLIYLFVDPATGLLRKTQLQDIQVINTNAEVFNKLGAHLQQRLASYPEGTRFSSELPIVNWLDGYAGTMDLVAFLPDGRIDILDWKTNELQYRAEWLKSSTESLDVSRFDQKYWKSQLSLYKRALFVSGVNFNDFRFTRAVPIITKFEKRIKDATRPKDDLANVTFELTDIEIGNTDITKIPKDKTYLIPVAVEDETTGNERLDQVLTKLWGYKDRIERSNLEKSIKFTELDRWGKAVRELQTRQTADSIVNIFTGSFVRIFKVLNQDLSFLDTLEPGVRFVDEETGKKLEKYIEDLTDSLSLLSVIPELTTAVTELYENRKTKEDKETLRKLSLLRDRSDKLDRRVEDKIKTLADKLATSFNIAGVSDVDHTGAGKKSSILLKITHLLSREEKSIQYFARMKNTMDLIHNIKLNDATEKFHGLTKALDEWSTSTKKTRAEAYSMIRKGDTEHLLTEIGPEFTEALSELRKEMQEFTENNLLKLRNLGIYNVTPEAKAEMDKAFEKKVRKWLEANVDVDKVIEAYERRKEGYIEYLESQFFHDDPFANEEEQHRLITEWEALNNPLASYKALSRQYIPNEAVKLDKWKTDQYKELLKPENKAVLDLYRFFTELNKRASKAGMLDDLFNESKFIPQIERSDYAYRLQKDIAKVSKTYQYVRDFVSPTMQKYNAALKDRSYSLRSTDESIDPVTRERLLQIPVYFKKYLGDEAESDKDLLFVFGKWAQHIMEYETVKEFEHRLLFARTIENLKKFTSANAPGQLEPLKNKAVEDELQAFIDAYVYKRTDIKDMDSGVRKLVQFLRNYAQNVFLSFNITSQLSNPLGGNFRRVAVMVPYTTAGDLTTAEMIGVSILGKAPLTSLPGVQKRIGKYSDIEERAHFLMEHINPLMETHRGFESFYKEAGIAKRYRGFKELYNLVGLGGYSVGDLYVQTRTALAVFMNTAIIDGKAVNIPQYVRSLYPNKYQGSKADRKRIEGEIKEKIKDLQQNHNLFTYLEKGPDGQYRFTSPAMDAKTTVGRNNILRVQGLAEGLIKDTLGNMSDKDKSIARTEFWSALMLQNRNWMPRQFRTYVGGLRSDYQKDSLEVGKWTSLWHLAITGLRVQTAAYMAYNAVPFAATAVNAVTDLAGLDGLRMGRNEAVINAAKTMYIAQERYLRDSGQQVPFTEAQFVDLYRDTADNMLGEIHRLATFVTIMFALFLQRDKHPDWWSSIAIKFLMSAWNELGIAYDPEAMRYSAEHNLPILGALALAFKPIYDLILLGPGYVAEKVGPSEVRKYLHRRRQHTHLLYDTITAIPGLRQANMWALSNSHKLARFEGIKQPKRRL